MGKKHHSHQAFYDPTKTYDANFDDGPSKVFDDEKLYRHEESPKFTFLGKEINSPFGIPAGPILNSQYVKYVFDRGFDVVCYKTQRSIKFKANDFPNVLHVDIDGDLTTAKAKKPLLGKSKVDKPKEKFSITNSFGNPSRGPDFWVNDMKKALSYQQPGQLLIGGVVGTIKPGFTDDDYFNDFAEAAELAAKSGVEVIEVNLSCPNVANEGILCYTPDSVLQICKKVKQKIGDIPLVVKFGYFADDQQKLLEKILKDISGHVAAISAINTIPAPVVDKSGKQALPGPNRLISGICGAGIKWAGLDMVQRLDMLRKKNKYNFEIIGVGGVMTPKDFHEYYQAGANVVQSATGAMWNPKLAAEIKATL